MCLCSTGLKRKRQNPVSEEFNETSLTCLSIWTSTPHALEWFITVLLKKWFIKKYSNCRGKYRKEKSKTQNVFQFPCLQTVFLFQIIRRNCKKHFYRTGLCLWSRPWREKDVSATTDFAPLKGDTWRLNLNCHRTLPGRNQMLKTAFLPDLELYTVLIIIRPSNKRESNLSDHLTKPLVCNSLYETELQGQSSSQYVWLTPL